ncbi:hypothetical protein TNCV_753931 [Trichonephila clavipes]|nr:hypothetical protein TNCV_753931 [Trichonephila clavipes]
MERQPGRSFEVEKEGSKSCINSCTAHFGLIKDSDSEPYLQVPIHLQVDNETARSNEYSDGLGSNPRGGMDICECIVPLWQEGTLNSREASSSREGGGREREVGDSCPPPGCFPSKLGWNRANTRTVSCMVLKPTV